MLKCFASVFIAAFLPVCFVPLVADVPKLEWDQTSVEVEFKPGEQEARAEFVVTNRGTETVQIARIKTSCGCTGSVLDRNIIEPGESSTITGTFNKSKRQGVNRNQLKVFLDGQTEPVATLHMIVNVPRLIEAQPQIVYWNRSTTKTERQIRLTLDKRYVSELSNIEYNDSELLVRAAADPDGKADRILYVLPKSFDAPIREPIVVHAKGSDGLTAEARLHIFVQP